MFFAHCSRILWYTRFINLEEALSCCFLLLFYGNKIGVLLLGKLSYWTVSKNPTLFFFSFIRKWQYFLGSFYERQNKWQSIKNHTKCTETENEVFLFFVLFEGAPVPEHHVTRRHFFLQSCPFFCPVRLPFIAFRSADMFCMYML